MSLPQSPTCVICGTKSGLLKCAGCKAESYCGIGHQKSDWARHKNACKGVMQATRNYKNKEAELCQMPGDIATPPGATIFREHAGRFWGIYGTRPYMRARYAVVEALLVIQTYAAVELALNHLLDMLRLCRSDNMGLRDVAPALYLRLGRDQECYDFLKWWATEGQREDYDWGDMDEKYLNLKDEDAFEAPRVFAVEHAPAAHGIYVTLLKIRLLLDIQDLKSAAMVGHKVPLEVLDNIRNHLASNIIARRQDIIRGENIDRLIKDLQNQISVMHEAVKTSNKHFWPALLRPGDNLTARPEAYSPGNKAEMQVLLSYSYMSWVETPGAIDYIRKHFKGGNS